MRSSNRLYALALVLILAGFVYGVAALFLLRYEHGDVYMPYSTYRADPLGSKAFYEALASIPDRSVRRNIEPLSKLNVGAPITLFLPGMTFGPVDPALYPEDLDETFADELNDIMLRGGRIVFAFAPTSDNLKAEMESAEEFQRRMDRRFGRDRDNDDKDEPKPEEPQKAEADPDQENDTDKDAPKEDAKNAPAKDDDKDKDDTERDRMSRYTDFLPKLVDWETKWQVKLDFAALKPQEGTETYAPVVATRTVNLNLPETLQIHSSLYFEPKSEDWKVLYSRDTRAVILERPVGDGSLVLVADAYLLSNQAMREDRRPELLAWLVGGNTRIVFDETTLGIVSVPSLMMMMFRYGLQGVMLALVILAALYIWKNAQPLVPHYEDSLPSDPNALMGKDSASGFTNLLRRSVPAKDLLQTCIAEWERAYSHRASDMRETARDIKAIAFREEHVEPKQRDLVRAYKEICTLVGKHRLG